MSKKVSGKNIAEKIKNNLREKISLLDREIIFSIVYVGQDPVIDNFIKYKKSFGAEIGISVYVHRFPENILENELIDEIQKISKKSDSMIIQLPLPDHLNKQNILDSVPLEQDVDVLSSFARSFLSTPNPLMLPPVTGAIVEILKYENYSLDNKKITLVGNGNLVGKPFSYWLQAQDLVYEIIHKNTDQEKVKKLLENADIIVSGVGAPNLIQPEMVSEGVVLIDAGTSESGKKVVGDIDPKCYEKSLFYTPVPGGIGPLTIAVLYQNILKSIGE